jgi:transcriptional regulator with PAS, ATPase and Fis domain
VVGKQQNSADLSEREILYKVLFDMKSDLNDLKKLVLQMLQSGGNLDLNHGNTELVKRIFSDQPAFSQEAPSGPVILREDYEEPDDTGITHEVEERLSLQDTEKEMIRKALQKHRNKRKYAARELGISERTLYRKIKEYNIS